MKKKVLSLLILASIFLSGCGLFDQAKETGEDLRNKGQEKTVEVIEAGKDKVKQEVKERTNEMMASISDKLKSEMKKKIDGWLVEQGLNEYGDPKGTMYIGGTPLFDETTGKSIDKYHYILNKFPELIEKFDLE